MEFPFEKCEWAMNVTLYNSTIYINEIETEAQKENRLGFTSDMPGYNWGFNFVNAVTEHTEGTSNGKEKYYTFVRNQVGDNSLLLSHLVDCSTNSKHLYSHNSYVELKLCKQRDKRSAKFRRNMFRSWAAYSLAGIHNLIVGLWKDGVVNELERFQIKKIPKMKQLHWNPDESIQSLTSFLDWLREVVIEDDPDVVYNITLKNPFHLINIQKSVDGSKRFLPTWFTNTT